MLALLGQWQVEKPLAQVVGERLPHGARRQRGEVVGDAVHERVRGAAKCLFAHGASIGTLAPWLRTTREPMLLRRSLVDSAEEALRNWLASGRHRLGDRLPPENALASMLGISRGTLRTALRRLEETGEIVRRQGSGTFVGEVGRPAGFREGLERLESYSSLARRRGVKLGAQDLKIETVALDRDLAERLGVEPGATATRVERVVVADGRPLALMVDTVHPDAPLPSEARLRRAISRGEMVLDVLLAEGVPIAYSMTSIAARLIGPEDAEGASLGVRQRHGRPAARGALPHDLR